MRSTSFRSTSLRQSVSTDSKPQLSANDFTRSAFRAHTALRTGWYGTSKKRLACRNAFECARPMKPYPIKPILRFFLATSLVPTVGVSNGDHGAEYVFPGLRVHHRLIRKHAAVPVDVLKRARGQTVVVAHPQSGGAHHIHLSVGIVGQAVPSRLVVRAGPLNRCIVLGHMEIDHPWPQHSRHTGERVVEDFFLRPVVSFRKNP